MKRGLIISKSQQDRLYIDLLLESFSREKTREEEEEKKGKMQRREKEEEKQFSTSF